MTNRRPAAAAQYVFPLVCEGRTHTTTVTRTAAGDYSASCSCGDAVTSMESWGAEYVVNLTTLHRLTGEAMVSLG